MAQKKRQMPGKAFLSKTWDFASRSEKKDELDKEIGDAFYGN